MLISPTSPDSAALLQALRRVPLFATLDDRTLRDVAQQMRRYSFRAGQRIMDTGEQSPGLFIVLQGRVRLSTMSSNGREQVLDMINPGGLFDLVPLFDNQPNQTSARAMSQVDVLLLPRAELLELLRAHPDLALAALHEMALHLRDLTTLVEDLAFRSVRARLARHLLAEAATGSAELTHQELAERAGTVREMVGRVLRRMADEGLIELARGRVIVLDQQGLQQALEE